MHPARLLAAALATVALAAAPTVAHAQTAPQPQTVALVQAHSASLVAVPKFIFHAGLAFGAFHHFIYIPFKDGKFTSGGFFSKLKTYTEAGLAAVFVYHEAKLALEDAQQNKVLKLLVSPLTGVVGVFNTIVSKVKHHQLNGSTVTGAASAVSSIEAQAKHSGSPITEAIPSAGQIAAGRA